MKYYQIKNKEESEMYESLLLCLMDKIKKYLSDDNFDEKRLQLLTSVYVDIVAVNKAVVVEHEMRQ